MPLHRNSSLDDIKHARDRLMLLYHPDKCGSDAYVPQCTGGERRVQDLQ